MKINCMKHYFCDEARKAYLLVKAYWYPTRQTKLSETIFSDLLGIHALAGLHHHVRKRFLEFYKYKKALDKLQKGETHMLPIVLRQFTER
jgi:hypothetical protein